MTPEKKQKILFGILLLVFFLAGFFFVRITPDAYGNEAARLSVIESLGERGCWNIDGTLFPTWDHAEYNGLTYSDKPLLLSFLCTGYYLLLKMLGITFAANQALVVFLINALFWAANTAIIFLAYRVLSRLLPDLRFRYRAGGALLTVCSTLLFSYGICINNHTAAALVVMILLDLLTRYDVSAKPFLAAAAGAAAGLLFNFDMIYGALFGAGLFFCCFTKKEKVCFALLFAGFAALLPLLNWLAYGSPLPLYILKTHHAGVPESLLHYVKFFFEQTFGVNGLFFLTPALLFGLPVLFRKDSPRGLRLTMILLSLVPAAYTFSTNTLGGYCYGARYLLPMAPVFLTSGIWVLAKSGKQLPALVFGLCCLWGCLTARVGAYEPWVPYIDDGRTEVRNSLVFNLFLMEFESNPHSPWVGRFFEYYGHSPAVSHFVIEAYSAMQKQEPLRAYMQMTNGGN